LEAIDGSQSDFNELSSDEENEDFDISNGDYTENNVSEETNSSSAESALSDDEDLFQAATNTKSKTKKITSLTNVDHLSLLMTQSLLILIFSQNQLKMPHHMNISKNLCVMICSIT